MRVISYLTAICVLMLPLSIVHAEQSSGWEDNFFTPNDILVAMQSQDDFEKTGALLYWRGIIEGIEAANAYQKSMGLSGLYCTPNEFSLFEEAAELLKRSISAEPELEDFPFQVALLMGLTNEHDCK